MLKSYKLFKREIVKCMYQLKEASVLIELKVIFLNEIKQEMVKVFI